MREPSGLLRFRTPLLGTAAAALVLTAGALAIPAAGSLAGPTPLGQTVDAACSPDADGAACALAEEAGNRKKSKKSTHRSGTRKPTKSRTRTPQTSKTPKTSTTRTRTAKTSKTRTTKSPKPTSTKTRTTKTGGTTTTKPTKTTTTGPTPSGTTTRTTRTTRTTGPTTTAPASILATTDFEDGTEQAWRGGNLNVVEAAAHSGKLGLQVGGLDKGQQTQLTVGVTDTSSWYQATVYLAVPDKSHASASGSDCARNEAKTKGGGSGSTPDKVTLAAPGTEETAGKGVLAVSSTWAAVDLMFKPYASDSTVTIALTGSSAGPDLLYVDDVVIVKIPTPRVSSTKGGHAASLDAPVAEGVEAVAAEARVADGGCVVASSLTTGGGSVRARLRTAV